MTIYLVSALMNCYLPLFILALTALAGVVTIGQARKVIRLSVIDFIELRSRWFQSGIDGRAAALSLEHRSRMLGIEADAAQIGVRRDRRALLASLEEVER